MAANAVESVNQLIFQIDMIQYLTKSQRIDHDRCRKIWALYEGCRAKKQRLHNIKVRQSETTKEITYGQHH
jgi:hypothetical protein